MKVVTSLILCLIVLSGLNVAKNPSSVDYVKLWQKYDKDDNDYIEAGELDVLCHDILQDDYQDEEVNKEKLTQFKEEVLNSTDINSDGKLDFAEAAVLLKAEDNFLSQMDFQPDKVAPSDEEIVQIFVHYEQDHSSDLDYDEILGFMRDLQGHDDQVTSFHQLNEDTEFLKKIFDDNHNGKLDFTEFKRLF